MINRRRPIQSIVAGRKMFSNGGVVPPPMGAPPMGAPPMGILNSSPELAQAASFSQPPPTLVDSMVNEATAGYGQGLQDSTAMNAAPVTMAHGGLASEDMMESYSHGGFHYRPPKPLGSQKRDLPEGYATLAGKILPIGGVYGVGRAYAESEKPNVGSLVGSLVEASGPNYSAGSIGGPEGAVGRQVPIYNTEAYTGDAPIQEIQTPEQVQDVVRVFDDPKLNFTVPAIDSRSNDLKAIPLNYLLGESNEEAFRRWMSAGPLDTELRPGESRAEMAKRVGTTVVKGAVNAIANDVMNAWSSVFSAEFAKKYPDMDWGSLATATAQMEERHPDLAKEIRELSTRIISRKPEITAIDLKGMVSKALSNKYEIGPHTAIVNQVAKEQAKFRDEGLADETGKIKPFTEEEIKERFYYGPGDETEMPIPRSEAEMEELRQQEAARIDAEAKVKEEDIKAQIEADEAMFQGTGKKPETGEPPVAAPERPDEYGTREGPFGTYMSDEDAREDLIKGQLRQVFGNYDIAQEFEGKKTKKENIRDIQFFKDRFKEAMPEYEGMSDSEKWFAVAEAGLRIMAGKSPNAITNIAEGLKGLGPELSKDAKERRAYNRQVDLSAAKYAVESVNTDEERAAALAKEGRVQKTFVVGKSFTDPTGTFRPAGSLYRPDTAFTRTEQFSRNILPNLTTEGIWKEILDNKSKLPKLIRQVASGKGSPTIPQLEKSFKEYNTLTDEARNSAKMLTMIDSSLLINAAGNVTGLTTWASSTLNKLKNSVNMKKELSFLGKIGTEKGEQSQQFRLQQQVVANLMLKEILGEGSKNVSNIDRDLAQQIVGLMSEWDAIFTDKNLLHRRLQNIRLTVYNGLESRMRQMKSKEFAWQNVINTAGIPVQEEFSSLRGLLKKDIERLPGVATRTSKGQQTGALRISDFYDFDTGKLKKKLPR